mgnify:CR=1 FL=1
MPISPNSFRLQVVIPVALIGIGLLWIAIETARQGAELPEPDGRDYPAMPERPASKPGKSLRRFTNGIALSGLTNQPILARPGPSAPIASAARRTDVPAAQTAVVESPDTNPVRGSVLDSSLASVSGINTNFVISGRVLLKGAPPPERPLPLDPVCSAAYRRNNGERKPTTRFYEAGPRGELAGVVVRLTKVSHPINGSQFEPLLIDQRGCEYLPYVSAGLIGQTILVRNSDPVLHNVHPTPAVDGNAEKNLAQLQGSPDLKFVFHQPEDFLRFKCDVHPWMFSYVTLMDHPFFATTDSNGTFSFYGPSPGTYTIQAIHRKAGSMEKTITVSQSGRVEADFTLSVP